MAPPSTMRAIKCVGDEKAALVTDAQVPSLRPDYVLVKINAVALNPTDWKHVKLGNTKDATVGCDYAGVVVEVGAEVTKKFKPGDRIAGFTHGVNSVQPEDGCFAEYAVAKGDTQIHIPDDIRDEEAATLGVGITTIGQALYQTLDLPLPNAPTTAGTALLIYGGSTSTGMFAIQFAKLSGLKVVTTCSPRNFDLVKSLGADAAFDYTDADKCGQQIREYTSDGLKYAFDCISEKASAKICCDGLSSAGGHYTALLPIDPFPRPDDVKHGYTLAYTAGGEAFTFIKGAEFPARPQDFEFAKKFWAIAEELLAARKFKTFPHMQDGGLEGTLDGMKALEENKVSAQKLVYKVV